jgi:hypothetical protein
MFGLMQLNVGWGLEAVVSDRSRLDFFRRKDRPAWIYTNVLFMCTIVDGFARGSHEIHV